MTLILDTLEQSIKTLQSARQRVSWCSHENPVWLTLWHAEQYLAREFKAEFNQHFKQGEHDNENLSIES